jgi:hypothetical protein
VIYKTFEQWMNGNFLEVKEPRKKAYTKDELLLVEMGWNYGYDAGRAVEQALDKKAENARELGLDYEPEERYTYGTPLLDAFTKPAPVQEPVAFNAGVPPLYPEMKDGETISVEYTTPPAAQRPDIDAMIALVCADERKAVLDTIDELMGMERDRHPMFSDGYDHALQHIAQFVRGRGNA